MNKVYTKEDAIVLLEKLYPKRDPSINPCGDTEESMCGTQRCYPAYCDAWLAHREWKRKNEH